MRTTRNNKNCQRSVEQYVHHTKFASACVWWKHSNLLGLDFMGMEMNLDKSVKYFFFDSIATLISQYANK